MAERVVVTGGSGRIGAHVVEELQDDFDVVVVNSQLESACSELVSFNLFCSSWSTEGLCRKSGETSN